jgi:hypothetical protein
MRGRRGSRNVQPKRPRAPFHAGADLFLEPACALSFSDTPVCDALGPHLSFVSSRHGVVRVGMFGARGSSAALAPMEEVAHRGNGPFVRSDVDRFLRRQRKTIAALEGLASLYVLATAPCDWFAANCSGASVAPAGAKTPLGDAFAQACGSKAIRAYPRRRCPRPGCRVRQILSRSGRTTDCDTAEHFKNAGLAPCHSVRSCRARTVRMLRRLTSAICRFFWPSD